MLHFGLNKVETNLNNDDIAGSKPRCVKFTTTREPSNPLTPVYKLQSFQYVPPPPPKFIRDNIEHSDIEGSKTKQPKIIAQRDGISVCDIEGAQSKKVHERKQMYDYISYSDVYAKEKPSNRCTNPLQPEYLVRDVIIEGDFLNQAETQINTQYGPIDKSKPQVLPNPISGVRNLQTNDIKGATADTKRLGAFTHYQRRDIPRPLT